MGPVLWIPVISLTIIFLCTGKSNSLILPWSLVEFFLMRTHEQRDAYNHTWVPTTQLVNQNSIQQPPSLTWYSSSSLKATLCALGLCLNVMEREAHEVWCSDIGTVCSIQPQPDSCVISVTETCLLRALWFPLSLFSTWNFMNSDHQVSAVFFGAPMGVHLLGIYGRHLFQ